MARLAGGPAILSVPAESDAALAALAGHNADAFAALYRRFLPRVYRFLLVRVGNVEDAQDLTAQTFMAALDSIHRFQGRGQLSTWLLAIARHKAADHFRQQRATLSLDDADELPDPTPPLDELAAHDMELAQVAQALRGLAPDRAEALALRLFAGLSAAEVGEVMGRSEAAAKMLVHRAVQDVRARLTPVSRQGEQR